MAPLHLAVTSGNLEIVKLLVSAGANINLHNKKINSPLFYALKQNNTEIAERLMQGKIKFDNKDTRGNTLLHNAASYGNLKAVKQLIKQNPNDINALNNQNKTPLDLVIHDADAIDNSASIKSTLQKAGGKQAVNIKNSVSRTPPNNSILKKSKITHNSLKPQGFKIRPSGNKARS